MEDDLFDPRLTEKRNLRTANIDTASPLEIVDLIEMETGLRDPELVVASFELLRDLGLVTW